ncbi:MAG: hypothetical protein ACOC7T_02440 [Planctomycetota bacterium]
MKLSCPCGGKVSVGEVGESTTLLCPDCGRRYRIERREDGSLSARLKEPSRSADESVAEQWEREAGGAEAGPGKSAFSRWWSYLGDAWTFSFQKQIGLPLLGWLVFYFLVAQVVPFILAFLLFGGLLYFVIVCSLFATLALYEFQIVGHSAWEPDTQLRLRRFGDWQDTIVRPLGQVIAILLASGIPYYAVQLPTLFTRMPTWWGYVEHAGWVGIGLLLPINVLAVATADSAKAVNPVYTFPAVAGLPGPYLLYCGFAYAMMRTSFMLQDLLVDRLGLGWIGSVLYSAVMVYALTVCARVLGTMHYVYSDRIGWLREEP